MEQTTDSPSKGRYPIQYRTKVGTGKRRFAGVDGRTNKARRLDELYRDCRESFDFGDTPVEVSALKNLCWKMYIAEEARALQLAGTVSLEDLVRCENSLDRALREARAIAKRRAKPATNSLLGLTPEEFKARAVKVRSMIESGKFDDE